MINLHRSLALLPFLSFPFLSCTNHEAAVGKPIGSLKIRHTTPKQVENRRLLTLIRSQPGTVFSEEKLSDDLRSLYESGLVEDVKFSVKSDGKSVRIVAALSTRGLFGPVLFVGNRLFTDKMLGEQVSSPYMKRIRRAIDCPLDSEMDQPIIYEDKKIIIEVLPAACEELRAFYKSKGHDHVRVTTRSWKGGAATDHDFVFVIDENSSTK